MVDLLPGRLWWWWSKHLLYNYELILLVSTYIRSGYRCQIHCQRPTDRPTNRHETPNEIDWWTLLIPSHILISLRHSSIVYIARSISRGDAVGRPKMLVMTHRSDWVLLISNFLLIFKSARSVGWHQETCYTRSCPHWMGSAVGKCAIDCVRILLYVTV